LFTEADKILFHFGSSGGYLIYIKMNEDRILKHWWIHAISFCVRYNT